MKNNKDIRFVRIHGRIVPIKSKGGSDKIPRKHKEAKTIILNKKDRVPKKVLSAFKKAKNKTASIEINGNIWQMKTKKIGNSTTLMKGKIEKYKGPDFLKMLLEK